LSGAEWARFATVSCTHVPYQSERAIDRLLQELRGRKLTHFIHLGDLVDAEAASVHADDPTGHSLLDEFEKAAEILASIREVLPKDCELILHDGNHDDNIQKADRRRVPKALRSLCNPRRIPQVRDEYRRWKRIPYRKGRAGCFQLGPVIFAHGWSAAANSDELEALQLVQSCGGHSHRLVVRGHTHRPVRPTQCRRTSRIPLPWWYTNVGHTAFDNRAAYTYRFDIEEWGRAMLVGECKLGRPGRIGSKAWDADLVSLD